MGRSVLLACWVEEPPVSNSGLLLLVITMLNRGSSGGVVGV
jgi:hypothetical protein